MVNLLNKKKGAAVMKTFYLILIGTIALALLAWEAAAQIQPWNTIIQFNRFQLLNQFGNAAVFDGGTGVVWEQSPDTNPQDWLNAQARCNSKTVGNRQGWPPSDAP